MSLIDRISAFMANLGAPQKGGFNYSPDDPRVAAVALLYHVMGADGVHREEEKDQLNKVLSDVYDVSGSKLNELLAAGKDADRNSVDLYAFTRVLKRDFNEEKRAEFVEMLWELVYADGERHELEDNVVWRIAELIGVEHRERLKMRQRVEARLNIEGSGEE